MASTTTDSLATFVLNTFKDRKENRKSLEARWNKNLNAFKNISDSTWKAEEGETWRSNTFIGKTRQKCIAGYSLIVNILLRDGKLPFIMSDAEEYPEGTPEDQKAETYAKEMQALIDRQVLMTETDKVIMQNILCACVLGETYQKKSITAKTKTTYVKIDPPEGVEVPEGMPPRYEIIEESIDYPSVEYVSPFNMYRDLEGDSGDIHHDYVSPSWLRKKTGERFFNKQAILDVIRDHAFIDSAAGNDNPSPAMKELSKRKKTIPYYEFWGRAPLKLAEEHERSNSEPALTVDSELYENDGNEIECMICVAGEKTVGFSRTEYSNRPFIRCVWQDDLEGLGGLGLPDNTNDKQTVLNGTIRAIEDNGKLAGNVILGIKERLIEGEVGSIRPGMKIPLSEECNDARQAMQPIVIPNVTGSLIELFTIVDRIFDEDSNIPKISQGIQTNGQQTAYETSKLVESSGKYVAGILRNFDKGIVQPDAEYFYQYNMEDPSCPVKGNYKVKPLGYVEYQNSFEKIQQMNQMIGLLQLLASLVENPVLAKDLKLRNIFENACRYMRVNADEFIITQKEKEMYLQSPEGQAEVKAVQLAEQQKLEVFELEKQTKLAEIKKYQAEAELALARIKNETTLAKSHAVASLGKVQNQKEQIQIQKAGVEAQPVVGDKSKKDE